MLALLLFLGCGSGSDKDFVLTTPDTTPTTPTTTTECHAVPWYTDADSDGFGDGASVVLACDNPGGLVPDGSDCDDADPARFPFAAEACDGIDADCGFKEDVQLVTIAGAGTYATLADAVAAAAPGDVLEVCPGTYPAALAPQGDLVLEGFGAREDVILQGQVGAAIVSASGVALTLRHLTLTGGGGPAVDGGGVSAALATALTVEDCVFSANEGAMGGALRGPNTGALAVANTLFTGNAASVGGAVYAVGGAVTDSELTANTADSAGGLMAIFGPTGALDLTGTRVHANTAVGCGGGLALGGAFTVTGGAIADNTAPCGGGVYAPDFGGALVGVAVTGNVAPGAYGFGGGVFGDTDATFSLVDCVVDGNTSGGWGGGVYKVDGGLTVTGGAITANAATTGGGVFLDGFTAFSATQVDLGSGAADNLPDDVGTAVGGGFGGFGANTDLVCDAFGCSPG